LCSVTSPSREPLPAIVGRRFQVDISKLPESEHALAIEATQNARVGALILLHDQYRLSPYSYCGCGDEKAVLAHFQKAIQDGKIKK